MKARVSNRVENISKAVASESRMDRSNNSLMKAVQAAYAKAIFVLLIYRNELCAEHIQEQESLKIKDSLFNSVNRSTKDVLMQ